MAPLKPQEAPGRRATDPRLVPITPFKKPTQAEQPSLTPAEDPRLVAIRPYEPPKPSPLSGIGRSLVGAGKRMLTPSPSSSPAAPGAMAEERIGAMPKTHLPRPDEGPPTPGTEDAWLSAGIKGLQAKEAEAGPETGRERRQKTNILRSQVAGADRLTELRHGIMGEQQGIGLSEEITDAARKGIAHGTLGLGEVVGLAMQIEGFRWGNEDLKRHGREVQEYWKGKASKYTLPAELQGEVWNDPKLMLNPEWLVYGVMDMVPSLFISAGAGAAGYRYATILGTKLKVTPQVLRHMAMAGSMIAGGAAGGALEGAHTFDEVLELTGDEQKAAQSAHLMMLAAGLLNSPIAGELGARLAGKVGIKAKHAILQFLKDGLLEGLTEWAEEPAEALIKMGIAGTDVFTPEMALDQIKAGFNVFLPAMITGFGGSAMSGRRLLRDSDNPYDVLGLPDNASEADLEKRFDWLMLEMGVDPDQAKHGLLPEDQMGDPEVREAVGARTAIHIFTAWKNVQEAAPQEEVEGVEELVQEETEGVGELILEDEPVLGGEVVGEEEAATEAPKLLDEAGRARWVDFVESQGEERNPTEERLDLEVLLRQSPENLRAIEDALRERVERLQAEPDSDAVLGQIINLHWALGELAQVGAPEAEVGAEPEATAEPAGVPQGAVTEEAPALTPPEVGAPPLPQETAPPTPFEGGEVGETAVLREDFANLPGNEEFLEDNPWAEEWIGKRVKIVEIEEAEDEEWEALYVLERTDGTSDDHITISASDLRREGDADLEAAGQGQMFTPQPPSPQGKPSWAEEQVDTKPPVETVTAPDGGLEGRVYEYHKGGYIVSFVDPDSGKALDEKFIYPTLEGAREKARDVLPPSQRAGTAPGEEVTPEPGAAPPAAPKFERTHPQNNWEGLPDPVANAFYDLGTDQRGAPEEAMRAVQHHHSGVLAHAVEHVGDLTHRMTEMIPWGRQYGAGRETVKEKVDKILRSLRHPYGFSKEHEENIKNNAAYHKADEAEYRQKLAARLEEYVAEHQKLPVYNEAQWLARQAAINLGRGEYDVARWDLGKLERMLETQEEWVEHATAHRLDENGNPMQYPWPEDAELAPPTTEGDITGTPLGEEAASVTAPGLEEAGPGVPGERPGTQEGSPEERPTPDVSGREGGTRTGGVRGGRPASPGEKPRGRDGDVRDEGRRGERDPRPDRPDDLNEGPPPSQAPERIKGQDYNLSAEEIADLGGPQQRARQNIDAIKLLKEMEALGRPATREEQSILAKFVGWGGLQDIFPRFSGFGRQHPSENWEGLHRELKELLTEAEFDSAKRTTQWAHYTSPEIVAFQDEVLRRLGVTGRVSAIEPGSGIGHQIGLSPLDARWTAIEVDPISASITKMLYPSVLVHNKSYEDVLLPDNQYQVAKGNPPFSDAPITTPRYGNQTTHDLFFLKTLDALAPGGILSFVTSTGTMDKVGVATRQAIADRADFLGAVRLPGGTFAKTAATEVTTDILFFQKRQPGATPNHQGRFFDTKPLGKLAQTEELQNTGLKINEYYIANPAMLLGDLTIDKLKRGRVGLIPKRETAIETLLEQALQSFPENIFSHAATTQMKADPLEAVRGKKGVPVEAKEGQWVIYNGAIHQIKNGLLVNLGIPKTGTVHQRLSSMIKIGEAAREVLRVTREHGTDEELAAAQKELGKLYDKFEKKHGHINKKTVTTTKAGATTIRRPNLAQYRDPVNGPLVAGLLERVNEDGTSFEKTDIFTERMHGSTKPRGAVTTAYRAVVESLLRYGHVDMPFMVNEYGKSEDQIVAELGDGIFQDPLTGKYETRETYLAGNVREKLAVAKEVAQKNPEFGKNVVALEQALPPDMTITQMKNQHAASVGVTWIEPSTYQQFLANVMGLGNAVVQYREVDGAWSLQTGQPTNSPKREEWSTAAVKAERLFRDLLNSKETVVMEEVIEDGVRRQVRDDEASALAEAKKGAIKQRWDKWIFEDNIDRTTRLHARYNETMNHTVVPAWDGSHLRDQIPGLPPSFRGKKFALRPFQLDAIWQFLSQGNMIIAQDVGLGKTIEMVIMGMEAKRMGLAQKPMYVIPNSNLYQWQTEFLEIYPDAKILVADETQFAKAARQEFLARVAADKWDAVLISHSSFRMIETTPELTADIVRQLLAEFEAALISAHHAEGENGFTTKKLQKAVDDYRNKLRQLTESQRRDDVVYFEDLGVDLLFVDEAHEYKNLDLPTTGKIPLTDAKKTTDMYIKTRHVERVNPGRSLVFASATPLSNSISEMYVMMRYVAEGKLKKQGLSSFDAWARNHILWDRALEMTPLGTVREMFRPRHYMNTAAMAQFFRSVANVKTMSEVGDIINIPPLEGGDIKSVIIPSSPRLREFVRALERRWDGRPKKPDKGDDNVFSIINDARYASIDARMVTSPHAARFGHDSSIPWDNTKATVVAETVFRVWEETKNIKGVQLVFSDLGVPKKFRKAELEAMVKELIEESVAESEDGEAMTREAAEELANQILGDENFDLYNEIKDMLMEKGIPAKEIAFMQEGGSNKKARQEIINRAKRGDVRVLLGSTPMMGQGVNVQDRLVAAHDVDVPWKPAWLQQRHGRFLRQGNLLYEAKQITGIQAYRYILQGGFDQRAWQVLENKLRFIIQAMTATPETGIINEISKTTLDLAEAAAIIKGEASDNPYAMDWAMATGKWKSIKNEKNAHEDRRIDYRGRTLVHDGWIKEAQKRISAVQWDIDSKWKDHTGDNFQIKFERDKEPVTERKKAGERLIGIVTDVFEKRSPAVVGSYGGFRFRVDAILHNVIFELEGHATHRRTLHAEYDSRARRIFDPVGVTIQLENLLKSIKGEPQQLRERMTELQSEIEEFKRLSEEPFAKQRELDEAWEEYQSLDRKMKEYTGDVEVEALAVPVERARRAVPLEQQKVDLKKAWNGLIVSPDSPLLTDNVISIVADAVGTESLETLAALKERKSRYSAGRVLGMDSPAFVAGVRNATVPAKVLGVVPADKKDGTSNLKLDVAVLASDAGYVFADAHRLRLIQQLVRFDRLTTTSERYSHVLVAWRADQPVSVFAPLNAVTMEEKIDAAEVERVMGPPSVDDIMAMLETGPGKVGAGVHPSAFEKLGANHYKENMAWVAAKESLQNSVDATRHTPDGTIHIEIYGDRLSDKEGSPQGIRIRDNGHGMTPHVAKNEFLDLAGSFKEEGSSGGYGFAIVGMLAHAKWFTMDTVARVGNKRVKTHIEGTKDDWIKGNMDVTEKEVASDTPTGTDIHIEFDTTDSLIEIEQARYFWGKAIEFNTSGVKIDVGDHYYLKHIKDKTKDYKDIPYRISVPGAEVFVRESRGSSSYGSSLHILNNGLFQFTSYHGYKGEGSFPTGFIVDVRPTVDTKNHLYPFTTNREEMKGSVEAELKKYFNTYQHREARNRYEALVTALTTERYIGNTYHRVYDTSGQLPGAFLDRVQGATYALSLVMEMADVHNVLLEELQKADPLMADLYPEFGGFGLGTKYLGVSIQRDKIAELRDELIQQMKQDPGDADFNLANLILVNPFSQYLSARVATEGSSFKTEADLRAAMIPKLAWRTYATILHELAHERSRRHDEAFSSALTFFIAYTGHIAPLLAERLERGWAAALATEEFHNDADTYHTFKLADLFSGVSTEMASFDAGGLVGRGDERGRPGDGKRDVRGGELGGTQDAGTPGRGPGPQGAPVVRKSPAGRGDKGRPAPGVRGVGQHARIRPVEEPTGLVPADLEGNFTEAAKALVKSLGRHMRYRKNKASKVTQQWKKALTEEQREDIGAYVEGIDNLRTGKSALQIRQEVEGDPAMKAVVEDYRRLIEKYRGELNSFVEFIHGDEYIKYVDNYLLHFYSGPKKKRAEFARRWTRKVPSAARRTFPTLQDAVDAGLTPLTQDVAELFQMWTELNWKGALNQAFIKELTGIRDEDGLPVILKPSKAPSDWKEIEHPAVNKVFGYRTQEGNLVLWRGPVRVHPDVFPIVQMITDQPFTWAPVKAIETVNAFAKRSALSLSLFHHFALTESAQAALARSWNPVRGLVLVQRGLTGGIPLGGGFKMTTPHREGLRLIEHEEVLRDVTLHGLNVDPIPDVMAGRVIRALRDLEAQTRNVPGLGYFTRKFRQANQKWDELLWSRYYTGLKVYVYYSLVEKQMMGMPENATPEEVRAVKEMVAELTNDMFGGQEWDGKFWLSPKGRQVAHLALLAPDWTLSNINVAAKTVTKARDPVARGILLVYWRNMLLFFVAMVATANKLCRGKFTLEVEPGEVGIDVTCLMMKLPWTDKKSQRRYIVKPGKQFREVLRYLQNPVDILTAKTSPFVQSVLEQATGHQPGHVGWMMPWAREDMGFYESTGERGLSLMAKFLPFAVRGNQFGFTFPMKRGMSWYKAQKAYEDIIRAQVDPSLYQRLMPQKDAKRLKAKIDASALENGLDPDREFRAANSMVRTQYYRQFWQAIDNKKMDEAERIGEILLELGAEAGNISQSGKSRGFTDEDIMDAIKRIQPSYRPPKPRRPSRRQDNTWTPDWLQE